jgi:threonine synthase
MPARSVSMGTAPSATKIVAQLGAAPDAVYLPVGGGDGLFGLHAGFTDLRHAGLIDRLPRMIGVRTAVLVALSIARDEVGGHALAAVRESQGEFVTVSERQVLDAVTELQRAGVSAEPASAAALAGLALRHEPTMVAVCVVTGHGLKSGVSPRRHQLTVGLARARQQLQVGWPAPGTRCKWGLASTG